MLRKNYYLILGVPRTESTSGIRAAYRDLVKRHHPDVAGSSAVGRFRDINEAYEVLSDPARRRRYNDDLAESERPVASGPLYRPAEPIIPQPPSVFDPPENIHPSFDELFERYLRDFTGIGVPKAEHEDGLNLEVVLTPEEASVGGVLPVSIPIFRECPVCLGGGQDWPFPCVACGAQGLVERQETVRIQIPPGIRPGTVFELPLRGLGVRNFYLRVYIAVGSD